MEEKLSVDEIMEAVRKNVRRKKAQGVYSDDDIQEVAGARLQSGTAEDTDEVVRQVRLLRRDYDFTSAARITSHRPVWGAVIVAVKKLGVSAAGFLAKPMLERQVSFNFHLIDAIELLAGEVKALKAENARLKELVSGGVAAADKGAANGAGENSGQGRR